MGQSSAIAVPLERVLALADPRQSWPWDCPEPDAAEVARLLSCVQKQAEPVAGNASAREHLGRVRYLAEHGGEDAITIDVGVPSLGYEGPDWPVVDGNHRLWAAALREDAAIAVDVIGEEAHAAELLGINFDFN